MVKEKTNSAIFISHAQKDILQAKAIALQLSQAGLSVVLDKNDLKYGDSFINFMERALEGSDYFLLLWSKSASQSKWVRLEWEAALCKTVEESQSFLVIGRLGDFPLPRLLAPRLYLDLFPASRTGVEKLIKMWKNDREVSSRTNKPVVAPKVSNLSYNTGKIIYISSKLFAKIFPLTVHFHLPIAVILAEIIDQLSLPKQIDVHGKVGFSCSYSLVADNFVLDGQKSLQDLNIEENSLLSLQVELISFSSGEPVSGAMGKATFRSKEDISPAENAQKSLYQHIKRLGLLTF